MNLSGSPNEDCHKYQVKQETTQKTDKQIDPKHDAEKVESTYLVE